MSNATSPSATLSRPLSVPVPAERENAADLPDSEAACRVGAADVIETDDLVEEVSIDGMCGVY